MDYLIILMLALRVFICEKVWPTAGIYFDISFCLCLILYILLNARIAVNRKLLIYPLVFVVLLLLNTVFSLNSYNSQNELMKFCMYMNVFIFVYLLDHAKREKLIYAILAASLIISLRALYQYLSGMDYINQHYTYDQIVNKGFYAIEMLKQRRVISWFLSPNLLAGYSLLVAPVALVYAINSYKQRKLKQSVLFTAVFILSALSLYFTRSWGAYLGFTVALLVIVINMLKTCSHSSASRRKTKWILIVGALVFIGAAIQSNRADYFLNKDNPQNSLMQRWYYWQSAEKIIQANPLSGVGLGNFGIVYPQFKNINANETIYAHNIFLQLCSELGIVMFICLAVLLIGFILKSYGKNNHERPVSIGLSAALIAFLVYNFFDFSFFVSQSGYLFFIIAACLLMPQQDEAAEKNSGLVLGDFLIKISYVLFCALMMFCLIKEYNSQTALDKAILFFKQGKIEQAVIQANKALHYRANNDYIYYFLAACSVEKNPGKFSPEAVDFYHKAIDLNPDYAFYYYYLADYYSANRFYPEAQKACDQAIKHYPHNKKFQELHARTLADQL